MGDEFTLKKPPILDIHVVGTAPIARLHIIKDFKHVYTTEPKRREVKLRWQDNDIERARRVGIMFVLSRKMGSWLGQAQCGFAMSEPDGKMSDERRFTEDGESRRSKRESEP
jgi:hypothetical protein